MIDKYRDTISGSVMLLLAAGYFAGSYQIRSYGDAAVDSRFFPQLLGGMLIVLSALQIVLSVRKLKTGGQTQEETQPGEEAPTRFNGKVVVTLAVILAYVLLIDQLGFVLSSSLFLIIQTRLMAGKGVWRPLLTIVVSVVFSYAVYRIFVDGFTLILPEGELLERLLG